ncbi:MAG: PKD domain-containing protein, partial [Bacteroidota bacterium]
MKTISNFFRITMLLVWLFSFTMFSLSVQGQEVNYKDKPNVITKQSNDADLVKEQIDKMKKDGILPYPIIDALMKQREKLILNDKIVKGTNLAKDGQTPVPFASCKDMGVENGWGAWKAINGKYVNPATITGPPGTCVPGPAFGSPLASPSSPRYNITSGTGIDRCTPSSGGPPITDVAPGFGNASIQLGEPRVCGFAALCSDPYVCDKGGSSPACCGCAEKLTYQFLVTAQDTNFFYTYAIVMELPLSPNIHAEEDKPYVYFCIRDENGAEVPCACITYVVADNLPGFYPTNICRVSWPQNYWPNGPPPLQNLGTSPIYYKPWTLTGVNLSKYVGKTLTAEIQNVDCRQGAHFVHSYWDFKCSASDPLDITVCPGEQVSITAPLIDLAIPYTYQWYQNGQPYTGTGSTSQTITPKVQTGDTFSVNILQPPPNNLKECGFWVKYIPKTTGVNSDFTYTGSCGIKNFTGNPTTDNGTPITTWNWSFPNGTPSSSTVQIPPTIAYPVAVGTYTATLIISVESGCKDTIQHTFTMGGPPTAAFTPTSPCLGTTTFLNDGSVAQSGDPIIS